MLIKQFNYLIKIEYDGSKFVGWQHQTNGNSIQDNIEKVLSKLLKEKIRELEQGEQTKEFMQKANLQILKRKKKYLRKKL